MSPRHNLASDFYLDLVEKGLTRADMLAQIGVLLLAVLTAWLLDRLVLHRIAAQIGQRRRLGQEGFVRVFFPLAVLVLTKLGELILHGWFAPPLKLLDIAGVLMLAMVNIRLLVFLLRRAFEGAPWVQRSERIVAAIIWVIYALHVVGVLPEFWQMLDEIQLRVGKGHISALNILQALTSVAVTVLVSLWIGREIERRLMASEVMDLSLRVMVIKVTRALLVVLAVLIALPLVGIDLTVLSVFGGALGVGLGFGLQKIASNYVSGFIILMDRSVKIGDIVQIDNRQGMVTQLTSRYIVLKGPDGNEALIPNETLITSTVVNQSYTDRLLRIALPIQVAYGSDLVQVQALLLEAARVEPRVVADPEPMAFIKGFGESGIDLELGVWINDPENGALPVRSTINLKIWQLFQANAIQIPYPQRELRMIPANPESNPGAAS